MSGHDETGWAYGVIYDDLGNCGCGRHTERLELLRDVLRDCPLFNDKAWRKYDTPAHEWLLTTMTNAELIEHGSSIGGSWITDKGKRLLAVLNNEAAFDRLTDNDADQGYCECEACRNDTPR